MGFARPLEAHAAGTHGSPRKHALTPISPAQQEKRSVELRKLDVIAEAVPERQPKTGDDVTVWVPFGTVWVPAVTAASPADEESRDS